MRPEDAILVGRQNLGRRRGGESASRPGEAVGDDLPAESRIKPHAVCQADRRRYADCGLRVDEPKGREVFRTVRPALPSTSVATTPGAESAVNMTPTARSSAANSRGRDSNSCRGGPGPPEEMSSTAALDLYAPFVHSRSPSLHTRCGGPTPERSSSRASLRGAGCDGASKGRTLSPGRASAHDAPGRAIRSRGRARGRR